MTSIDSTLVVLASTSRYRRELLARVLEQFSLEDPGVDEAPLDGETPHALVERLARAKALAVAVRMPRAVVIGSDQVAVLDGEAIGKPGTLERAAAQLRRAGGRELEFLTALAVASEGGARVRVETVPTLVRFRTLDEQAIASYLAREPALDCAGSFKSEGLGAALLEHMRSDDPTALIGLPLIALSRLLREAGVDVLAPTTAQIAQR